MANPPSDPRPSLAGRVVLVTGAAKRVGSSRHGAPTAASGAPTVRRSLTSVVRDRTDRDRVATLDDDAIERAIADDPDAAPLLDTDWFAKAKLVAPREKALISIRLDQDLLDFFRAAGPGYQTRINAVLRAFMDHEVTRGR